MYQHFVPQFLLRNFSHPYEDATTPNSAPKGKKWRKRSVRKDVKLFPGDLVVHTAALTKDPIELVEMPVKRVLGQMDMYKDTNQPPPKQQHIENMFGCLESRVSGIFRKIIKAFEAGDPGLWLTRKERNEVRKFLFLLKYRGSGYHRRFCHPTTEEYDSDDKEIFLEYIAEKGFVRPIDVWFHNLKTIMELEMDPAGVWMDTVRKSMYRADAEMFIMHTQAFYMAICTPEDPSDEFIVTDGCFNVFEGRCIYANDVKTEQPGMVSFINFHEFAPISPKLIIILRSFLFPIPEEDADPENKKIRNQLRAVAVDNIFGYDTLKSSLLFDLPIKKARNSYSRIIQGTARLAEGEDGTHRLTDKFCFNFFPIQRIHIWKINGCFFDNAFTNTNIVFASKSSFFRSLEWYMTASPELIGKHVKVEDGDKRLEFLQRLDVLMKAMGSDKQSTWKAAPLDESYNREFHQFWITYVVREGLKIGENSPSSPNKLLIAHALLGGSATEFWGDFEQSKRMWVLRVKIDSWSQGVDEDIRQRNRDLLTEAYLRCPPRRVWLYMKIVKYFHLVVGDSKSTSPDIKTKRQLGQEKDADEIEDIIARAKCFLDDEDDMNRILHTTVTNEIEMRKRPGFNIWEIRAFTMLDLPQIVLKIRLVFENPGPICCCGILDHLAENITYTFVANRPIGIPEIEVLAMAIEHQLRILEHVEIRGFDATPFSEDQIFEILTRIKIRAKFAKVLQHKMKARALDELKTVFFKYTYPTPPTSVYNI